LEKLATTSAYFLEVVKRGVVGLSAVE